VNALAHLGALVTEGPVGVEPNTGETVTFWICATLAVLGALGMVLSRKAVHSALFIALTMINLAVLYVVQDAVFLGMVQIIVYTGAVMMLFVFVLMVVGVDASDSLVETIKGQRFLAGVAFVGFLGLLLAGVVEALDGTAVAGLDAANAEHGGNIQGIGVALFTRYLLAFEVTSALLITAGVGAMVLTHRERVEPRKTQPQLSTERFGPDQHPVNKPSPGVYARNNAVDMPALLPDGSVAEDSVPAPLRLSTQTKDADLLALDEAEHLLAHESVTVDPDGPRAGGGEEPDA
jgi:NADH-quinone oxidoreductase subunit J